MHHWQVEEIYLLASKHNWSFIIRSFVKSWESLDDFSETTITIIVNFESYVEMKLKFWIIKQGVQIQCVGEGPVIHVTPTHVDYGTIPVLTEVSKIVQLSNESLIPAQFSCCMVSLWLNIRCNVHVYHCGCPTVCLLLICFGMITFVNFLKWLLVYPCVLLILFLYLAWFAGSSKFFVFCWTSPGCYSSWRCLTS